MSEEEGRAPRRIKMERTYGPGSTKPETSESPPREKAPGETPPVPRIKMERTKGPSDKKETTSEKVEKTYRNSMSWLIAKGGIAVGTIILWTEAIYPFIIQPLARRRQEKTGANRTVEAKELLNEWSLAEKTDEAEIQQTAKLLNFGDILAEGFFNKSTPPDSLIRNVVVMGEGMDFETRARYEALGLPDPDRGRPRDMDIVLENSQDWYIRMRVYMRQLRKAIENRTQDGRISSIDADTGEGLANYCVRLYKPQEKIEETEEAGQIKEVEQSQEGCYLVESLYRAFAQESQLSSNDAQRLKTYVEETLNKDWYGLKEESFSSNETDRVAVDEVQQIAEWSGVNTTDLLGGLETLTAETQHAKTTKTESLVSAYDFIDSLYVDKPSGGVNFGPESLVLMGLAMVHVGKVSFQRSAGWLKSLGRIGAEFWKDLTKSNDSGLASEVKNKINRRKVNQ